MAEIEKNIIKLLERQPGLTDRDLAEAIKGRGKSTQYINQTCRALAAQNVLLRQKRSDGRIGNWLKADNYPCPVFDQKRLTTEADEISEKRMKQVLETYLTGLKWQPRIAWGAKHGVDIEATRGKEKWIIEVKGSGEYNPLRVNLFLSVLGELLQRMDDPGCKYSIALPDIDQFRRLWDRLPGLAKSRTAITVLFVDLTGRVTEKAG
jgi:hypothetical protein